jgi:hypothetical protein
MVSSDLLFTPAISPLLEDHHRFAYFITVSLSWELFVHTVRTWSGRKSDVVALWLDPVSFVARLAII